MSYAFAGVDFRYNIFEMLLAVGLYWGALEVVRLVKGCVSALTDLQKIPKHHLARSV
jgi:hypothetical protein